MANWENELQCRLSHPKVAFKLGKETPHSNSFSQAELIKYNSLNIKKHSQVTVHRKVSGHWKEVMVSLDKDIILTYSKWYLKFIEKEIESVAVKYHYKQYWK